MKTGGSKAAAALAGALLALSACGDPNARVEAPTRPDAHAQRPPDFPEDESAWGKYHSKRFLLSVPLPDGRSWRIDDHSGPALVATHPPTGSRIVLFTTDERELMNRQKCEERARETFMIPKGPLRTIEDATVIGPEAYDSRVWVAVEPGSEKSPRMTGHVFLFGAFVRKCLFVHFSTEVPSSGDEAILSSRLAVARARLVAGIAMDPPRVTEDADVPREKPAPAH